MNDCFCHEVPGFKYTHCLKKTAEVSDSASLACSLTPTCEWVENEGYWETGCGDEWMMNEGTPKENGMNFCPMCVRPLTG